MLARVCLVQNSTERMRTERKTGQSDQSREQTRRVNGQQIAQNATPSVLYSGQ